VQDRLSRLDDGVFAAWAMCLPFSRKDNYYSELIRTRRQEWFYGVPASLAETRARLFFTRDFLLLDLGQLARLVASPPTSNELVGRYLGNLPLELS